MTDPIRSPNLPFGTSIDEFIGHEIVGGTYTAEAVFPRQCARIN
jgi:hypothetical protein